MSRAAEEAHEKWFLQHLSECARDLVVGAKVYRVNYNRIEEGEVVRVSTCDYHTSFGGSTILIERHDGKGSNPYYVARFRSTYEEHEWQWRWFFKKTDAQQELIKQARDKLKELQRDMERWEDLIATTKAELNEATEKPGPTASP